MSEPLPDVADRFVLRMPKKLRKKIALAAKQKGRSINAEIVSRLEETIHHDDESDVVDVLTLETAVEIKEQVQNLSDQMTDLLKRLQAP